MTKNLAILYKFIQNTKSNENNIMDEQGQIKTLFTKIKSKSNSRGISTLYPNFDIKFDQSINAERSVHDAHKQIKQAV